MALLLAPVLAFVRYAEDWFPTGDPALMAFRALDVGTSRTPLIGQPSLSGNYVEDHLVHHLGAIHFYLLAPFVRVVGVNYGMILVSVLITAGSLLIAAWALFRQLGPTIGAWAAVVLGVVSFTTGASSFVLPVSSSIAGYPFLCSIVLLWCVLCGDLRLLPLTTGVVSFTAMQHLSVLPSLAVATAAAVVGSVLLLTVGTRRVDRPSRQEVLRWVGGAGAVALVLWVPLLFQNFFGNRPNLSALLDFSRDSDRPKLGYGTALRHVAHVLGLPPLLGRREVAGTWLFTRPSLTTWVTAALVFAMLCFAAWHWRRSHPRRAALAAMGVVMAFAGLFGSATVPEGNEETRLVFYHWVFPLAALALIVAGLLVSEVVERLKLVRPGWQPALMGVAVLAIAVPSLVNPSLDRWTNTLQAAYPPFEREVMEDLADQVMLQRDRLDGTVVLVARNPAFGAGLDSSLALQLEARGLSLKHARYQGVFVDGERQTTRRDVDLGLVLVLYTNEPFVGYPEIPRDGELIATQEIPGGISLWSHYDQDASDKWPASLQLYLLDRDELLDWATREELARK